jgi:hypothetical protein
VLDSEEVGVSVSEKKRLLMPCIRKTVRKTWPGEKVTSLIFNVWSGDCDVITRNRRLVEGGWYA